MSKLVINSIAVVLFFGLLAISFFSGSSLQKNYQNLKKRNDALEKKIAEKFNEEGLFHRFNKHHVWKIFLFGFLILVTLVILVVINKTIEKLEQKEEENDGGDK